MPGQGGRRELRDKERVRKGPQEKTATRTRTLTERRLGVGSSQDVTTCS